jgi:cytoskeletal protein CcmA (bactofilin family)
MRNFGFDQRAEQPEPVRAPAAPPPSPAAAERKGAERKVAVLGPTLRFKGELSAEEDFILQGRIEGSINHTQSVTIGTDGSVVGNIHARVITVDGNVEGDLHGAEAVIVHQTAHVTGNIFAPRVGIVEGASFNGRVEMGATRAAASEGRQQGAPRAGGTAEPLSAEETQRMLAPKF